MVDQYQDSIIALEGIKAAKQALKEEHKAICEEITKAQDELAWLQTSYLPLQDFKEGIIQFLSCSGQNYGMGSIRPTISNLATNLMWGIGFPQECFGLPMKFKDLEKAIAGSLPQFPACQIFTPDKSMFFDDRAFLALLFKVIEPTIREIMERMQPEEFGYGRINQSEIGPGLEERRQMITDVAAKILDLDKKKSIVIEKLGALEI